ncbi:gram-negative bacteria-binding protein 1 [Drosophila guanche]|uniref:Blast:Gram-negative bacteria-binding protein 2 n=1 Tax=Drosophila guanche TaxID=7266 RepID=A0A3B0JBB3_DROGU|nr:gram-negative bacteria-binding protein 1 [Drosophila guanche]XP_034120605.1 gram-negative bacteria-binding protein 1 [Drosophila guanche]SPP77312.1 blast:Gram-negative bacteria-binding protein 2 [Drosophila guanche]
MHGLTTIGVFLLLWTKIGHSEGYKVPTAKVELLDNGFRVSIPDETGVRLVAFNVNRNRNFTSFTQGQYSTRLLEPQNKVWSHDFLSVPLRAHDVLYIWTSVQHERAIFQDLAQPIHVCTLSGENLPKGCTTEEPTENNSLNTEDTIRPSSSSSERAQPEVCEPSSTTISPASSAPICKGQLLFHETFDQLNETRWMHEVRVPLDTKDAEFVLYDGKARVQDGNLVIQPILWSSYRPDLSISNCRLDLSERCTGTHNSQKECSLHTSGSGPSAIMPPVVAPRISTKESFAIKYGRIEIRAKMPKGDWLVPLLLLEPLTEWYGQTGYESGQLRVAMARGNSKLRMPHGKLVDGRSLYAGPVLSTDALQREDIWASQRRNVHFGDDFHTYSLDWSSERLRFSVDGQVYGEMLSGFAELDLNKRWKKGGPMAPFDRMFYITLGMSVGGFGDFVDNLRTATYEKPWMNYHPQAKLRFFEAKDHWLPSWKQPSLLVDYVRVYAN